MNLNLRLVIALILLGTLSRSVTNAQTQTLSDEELRQRIGEIVTEAFGNDGPGAAVIAVRGGETIYRGARGLADIELNVPLDADNVFRLGSITKQFTAAAIMILVEEGKISLDDDLTKFLPDYPTHGKTITVEHLLTHTSGIKSYTNMPGWMATKIRKDMTVEELIDGFKDEPMEFEPGEKFNYNNSGYVLLGAIIEKASGETYADFVQERIFDPNGMQNSYYGDAATIIPKRASGYGGRPGDFKNSRYISMTQPYAAGSLLSTVDDLARWNTALFSGKVVSSDSLEKMTTPYEPSDGDANGYGYGLVRGDMRGHLAISHGGGIFGFVTFAVCLPDDDVYVAVLCNSGANNPRRVANRIAALVAGDPYPTFKRIKLTEEQLKKYVGVYRIDEDTTRTVTVNDGKLFTKRSDGPRQEAIPASETEFFYEASFSHFEFEVDADGAVTAMRVYQDGSKEFEEAQKTDEKPEQRPVVELDPELLDDYVGKYEAAPGMVITIRREGNQLFAQANDQREFKIVAESETKFHLEIVEASITFVRNDDGEVEELQMRQGGQQRTAKRVK